MLRVGIGYHGCLREGHSSAAVSCVVYEIWGTKHLNADLRRYCDNWVEVLNC